MFSMAAPPSDPLPDTDAEVEYPEQRCETVQSSPYYDRQLGGAAADGFKTANAPADLENGSPEAEYYCETAPIGESGEEGSLLTAWYGPVVLELYGAGATDYVTENGGVKAGDRVGIIGLGGLGQIGARVAHLLGAEVHVAEIKEDIWPLAKELGAVDARRSITDYPRGFFDVIVDFAGFGDTTADAVDVIRLGGVVVLVGMGRLETTIDAKSLIVNQCDLRGSNGGTPDDIRGVYELMRTGKLTPVTTTVSFDEVPEAIERLERGDVVGRLVISYE